MRILGTQEALVETKDTVKVCIRNPNPPASHNDLSFYVGLSRKAQVCNKLSFLNF